MDDYVDLDSSSDSELDADMIREMDSDEEEQYENKRLLKMFQLHDPPSKNQLSIQDFEAEMEAELDRRASEIELKGGMEHQKSISRSSSSSSLNKSPRASPVPGPPPTKPSGSKRSNLKRAQSDDSGSALNPTKSVKFSLPSGSGPEATSASSNVPSEAGSGSQIKGIEKKAKEMYDELYFDSDESDGEDEGKKERKEKSRRFMTDDELFYDPSSDAKDQAWIDKQRRKSYGQNKSASSSMQGQVPSILPAGGSAEGAESSSKPDIPLPTTDAILNCPACFTTVCHDCQRHDVYVGQYRAMFVKNCVINMQEILSVPEKARRKLKSLKKHVEMQMQTDSISSNTSDMFHPVACKVCKTQIAMYDNEEVYHFFNVLASQP